MTPSAPALVRRLASGLYELLVLVALVLPATFPFLAVFGDATHGWRRHVLQAWVLVVWGAYFTWFWTRGGQTLPMKTWNLRIVSGDGGPLSMSQAIHRYVLAVLGFFAATTALRARPSSRGRACRGRPASASRRA